MKFKIPLNPLEIERKKKAQRKSKNIAFLISIIPILISSIALMMSYYNMTDNKKNNDSDSLQKTLSFFEQGKNTKPIAIAYIKNIWIKKREHDDIIIPVLISELRILLKINVLSVNNFEYHNDILFLLNLYIQISDNCEMHRKEIHSILKHDTYYLRKNKINEFGSNYLIAWYERFEKCLEPKNFIESLKEIKSK